MAKHKYLAERPEWLAYDDDFGGIDYNSMKNDMTHEYCYYYGLTFLNNGFQVYFDKNEARSFFRFITDRDNQAKFRKELLRLDEEHKAMMPRPIEPDIVKPDD